MSWQDLDVLDLPKTNWGEINYIFSSNIVQGHVTMVSVVPLLTIKLGNLCYYPPPTNISVGKVSQSWYQSCSNSFNKNSDNEAWYFFKLKFFWHKCTYSCIFWFIIIRYIWKQIFQHIAKLYGINVLMAKEKFWSLHFSSLTITAAWII